MERFTSDLKILSADRQLKIEALDAHCNYNRGCDGTCPFYNPFYDNDSDCNAPTFWDDTSDEELNDILQEWIDAGIMLENGMLVSEIEDNSNVYDDINKELDLLEEVKSE